MLLAAMPHMHLRGKSFQVRTRSGDNEFIQLDVPHYDFNWQHTYEWSEPIPLRDIDRLSFTATFDNSVANPFNPNPNEFVMWGDQTWEEMAVAFFEVARPRTIGNSEKSGQTMRVGKASANNNAAETSEAAEARVIAFADDFLSRFDTNGDRMIVITEVPRIVRDYSFWTMDENRDGKVTRDELLDSARARRGR